jgi:4-cresol dehydrogenase (hydroxylating)
MSVSKALPEWCGLLGDNAVRTDTQTLERFGRDTSRSVQRIAAVLQPRCVDLVPGLVTIAARHKVPIYPVSTGRNWGYGTALPPVPGCVVVDLSGLRAIGIDDSLGVATLEPGVTQGDLHQHLFERKLPFLVPATGAGPNCSLVGNALERGFGITPFTDHFAAVTSINAVLPNGEEYRTPFSELGATRADRAFKWGLGPYLDGLFSQGSFGIVTRMTIALARRPEQIMAMFFFLDESTRLESAVEQLQRLLDDCGGSIGGLNLMNRARMQAMGGSASSAASLVSAKALSPWTGAGAIYGCREVVRGFMRRAKATLGRGGVHLRFVDPARVAGLHKILVRLPPRLLPKSRERIRNFLPALKILTGEPSEVALPLAYARNKRAPPERDLDPARDRCGLYWYAPIVPMTAGDVRKFVTFVEGVTGRHGLGAPITFTSLSNRCFDATVPLLFDTGDAAQAHAAEKCYQELFDTGRIEGFVPYRMGSQFMPLAVRPDLASWKLVALLKAAVDPDGILAPGRYAPV